MDICLAVKLPDGVPATQIRGVGSSLSSSANSSFCDTVHSGKQLVMAQVVDSRHPCGINFLVLSFGLVQSGHFKCLDIESVNGNPLSVCLCLSNK